MTTLKTAQLKERARRERINCANNTATNEHLKAE